MLYKAQKLQKASWRAQDLINKLHKKNPSQWNYGLIKNNIEQTYKMLKNAWINGETLDSIKEYFSEQGYKLLSSDSTVANADLKYLDLLDCFDCELKDLLIVSVLNFPETQEDYVLVWLDNEYSSTQNNLCKLNSFDLNNKLSVWNILEMSSNDCWTFKWSSQQEKWVLHNITLDNLTNSYLEVLGKSFSSE